MPKLVIVPINKKGVLIDIQQFSEIPTVIDDAIYYNFIGDFTLDEVTAFAKSLENDERKYVRVLFNNTSLSYIFERGTLVSNKSGGATCSG